MTCRGGVAIATNRNRVSSISTRTRIGSGLPGTTIDLDPNQAIHSIKATADVIPSQGCRHNAGVGNSRATIIQLPLPKLYRPTSGQLKHKPFLTSRILADVRTIHLSRGLIHPDLHGEGTSTAKASSVQSSQSAGSRAEGNRPIEDGRARCAATVERSVHHRICTNGVGAIASR